MESKKKKKVKERMNQPHVASSYTSFMVWGGGVDFHKWLLEKNSVAIRKKKWYMCLITKLINMTAVNVFVIYEKVP